MADSDDHNKEVMDGRCNRCRWSFLAGHRPGRACQVVLRRPGSAGPLRRLSVLRSTDGQTLVWSVIPADTDYFGSRDQAVMINYRVDDLDGSLQRLRDAGVPVDDRTEQHDYGKFGWAVAPEGNRFELWEPPPGQ
jgi:hypothetical protein